MLSTFVTLCRSGLCDCVVPSLQPRRYIALHLPFQPLHLLLWLRHRTTETDPMQRTGFFAKLLPAIIRCADVSPIACTDTDARLGS